MDSGTAPQPVDQAAGAYGGATREKRWPPPQRTMAAVGKKQMAVDILFWTNLSPAACVFEREMQRRREHAGPRGVAMLLPLQHTRTRDARGDGAHPPGVGNDRACLLCSTFCTRLASGGRRAG